MATVNAILEWIVKTSEELWILLHIIDFNYLCFFMGYFVGLSEKYPRLYTGNQQKGSFYHC